MLKDQILQSRYFKTLLQMENIDDLIEDIVQYADTMEVYNAGGMTTPSCFICQVYRLFTLPHAEDFGELETILDNSDYPIVRCVGFVYIRFVVNPTLLLEKLEEYLFDSMELKYVEGNKQVVTTIGDFVETLLFKEKYFGTPLPRIPAKVRQLIDRELAPLAQYRKRMDANLRTFKGMKVAGLPIEVVVDGRWVPATAKDFVGRSFYMRKLRVTLDNGDTDAIVHLGKVVLRDASDGSSSDDAGGRRKRRRSRSRSRSRSKERNGSPDWSRYKGRADDTLVEELRERYKEEAVCTWGKAYAKRPLTVEQILWRTDGETRVSMLGPDEASNTSRRSGQGDDIAVQEATLRRKREEEEERNKRMREIYEKYGSASKARGSSSAGRDDYLDKPDVLRLG